MNKILIILTIVLFTLQFEGLYSQAADTTTAVRIVTRLDAPDELLFELRLQRLNTNWQRWANGSFLFEFNDSTLIIDSAKYSLEFISRDGMIGNTTSDPNFINYTINTKVLPGRFSVNMRGPDVYVSALEVPIIDAQTDDTLTTYSILGTFRIKKKDKKPFILTNNDTTNNFRLFWKRPTGYYQASSFKTDVDVELFNKADYYKADDNVELYQPLSNALTVFYDDDTPKPKTVLRFIDATYEGAKKISVQWVTRSEAFVKGWAIYRGSAPFGKFNIDKVEFNDLVASFLVNPTDTRLLGLGTVPVGKAYFYSYDSTNIERGANYCYEIRYVDFNDNIIEIPNAKVCVNIPNSVLTFAKAYPNPMERQTQVSYNLEDDALVTIKLYDMNGKLAKIIQENVYVKKGQHIFDLELPEFSALGLYDLLINADPVDDKTIERSFSVLKLQVIR